MLKRGWPFSFCKGHFHLKVCTGNMWRGTMRSPVQHRPCPMWPPLNNIRSGCSNLRDGYNTRHRPPSLMCTRCAWLSASSSSRRHNLMTPIAIHLFYKKCFIKKKHFHKSLKFKVSSLNPPPRNLVKIKALSVKPQHYFYKLRFWFV